MAILKCKMCGGDLEVTPGMSVAECIYCGTQQTLIKSDDEGIQSLFNRANALRMKAEFDKASDIYEKILQRNDEEAEAYWGLILCKYGIEYVEDPATFKRIPTCHRASYDAVTADEDYKNAIKYADFMQKKVYEEEAAAIEEIQKGIIALAQKEDPYDVFICYKESDESGNRTQDSVIANDIYHQLTQEGFKVFYAAISLEDKLGKEYEPYIFSALNTAKVMLSLGTKPEYFNAVWVKNEWSRFLKIMKKDRSRLLIPCYRDMDPYELPEEFAHLQAQNMGKIGFINDIIRGIKKVIVKEEVNNSAKETAVVQQTAGSTTANAQVQRGNMALEDHEWQKADGFFEEALNLDPQCAEAYIGKMLARDQKSGIASWVSMQKGRYNNSTTERLEACTADSEHINKMAAELSIKDYLDKPTIKRLYEYDRGYDSALSCRKKQKEKQLKELSSDCLLNRAKQYATNQTAKQLEEVISAITAVLDQRISEAQEQDEHSIARVTKAYAEHLEKADREAEELNQYARNRREKRYQDAKDQKEKASDRNSCEKALNALTAMKGYKDSDKLAAECQKEIDRLKEEERQEARKEAEQAAKKKKTIIGIFTAVAVACIAAVLVVTKVIIPNNNYNAAVALMESGEYEEAISAFEAMNGYKDSAEQITACQTAIKENEYAAAVALMESGEYIEAYNALDILDGFKDSEALKTTIKYDLLSSADVGECVLFGSYEQDDNATNGKEDIEWIVLEKDGSKILVTSKYALECREYHITKESVTWESCSLRGWLNETFLNDAFDADESAKIVETVVSADKNPKYSTNPGNDTKDIVFLLSIPEAEKYFADDGARKCVPTEYAISRGAYTSDSNSVGGKATCCWWLRSPGDSGKYAADVDNGGSVDYIGDRVNCGYDSVRPALWIDLES